MGRFDFYIIERQLKIFALLIGTLVTVFWINLSARGFAEFFSDSQAIKLFLLYVFYELPTSLFQSLTLAAYAAATYVSYRLYSDQELWAMQSAGASPVRLMRPFMGFGAMMAVLAAILVHEILPDSRSQGAGIRIRMQSDISQFRIQPGQFLFPTDGVAMFVRDVSDEMELLDVFIHSGGSHQKNRISHFAKTGRMTQFDGDTLFEMKDGMTQLWDPKVSTIRLIEFDTMRFNLSELAQEFSDTPRPKRHITSLELLRQLQNEQSEDTVKHRLWVEIHRRIAYSLAAFLFPIIGAAALAAAETYRIRLVLPIVGSLTATVGLFLLGEFFRDWVRESGTSIAQMYLPTLLGAVLALGLIVASLRPMRLMVAKQ